jgi:hypothetical protein
MVGQTPQTFGSVAQPHPPDRDRARRPAGGGQLDGLRRVPLLGDYLGALDLRLDAELYRHLDQASSVALGQPHEVIAAETPIVLGGDTERFRRLALPVA